MRTAALRLESAPDSGFGHLQRGVALARALADEHSFQIRLLLDEGPWRRGVALPQAALEIRPAGLDEASFVAAGSRGADLLVLDTRHAYSRADVRSWARERAVVVVDNFCPGAPEADLAVFPGAHLEDGLAKDTRWKAGPASVLVGAEYVLIGPPPAGTPLPRSPEPTVAVMTGGRDPAGVAAKLLPWTADLDAEFVFFRGAAAADPGAAHARARVRPFHLAEAAAADLVVTTFGVAVYELLRLGAPTVVVGHTSENAEAASRLVARTRAAVDLGFVGSLTRDRFTSTLTRLLADPQERARLAAAGPRVVDGLGASRVADASAKAVDAPRAGGRI